MRCKVKYCGEWELATCIETGYKFCKVQLEDDPRVILDVPASEIVWLLNL